MKFIFIALLAVWSVSALALPPCGSEGSIEKRVKDCDYKKEGFALVTRTKDSEEYYLEVSTGLIWSERAPYKVDSMGSHYLCTHIDRWTSGFIDNWTLSNFTEGIAWTVPTVQQYEEAEKNGIRQALSDMDGLFWAVSPPCIPSRSIEHCAFSGNAFIGFTSEVGRFHVWGAQLRQCKI